MSYRGLHSREGSIKVTHVAKNKHGTKARVTVLDAKTRSVLGKAGRHPADPFFPKPTPELREALGKQMSEALTRAQHENSELYAEIAHLEETVMILSRLLTERAAEHDTARRNWSVERRRDEGGERP